MPELNTRLDFLPPYMQERDNNDLGTRSFMSAMEEARQQQTPMYKAQLQQIQQQNALAPLRAQMLGYQVKDAALGYEMQQFAREDAIAGKEQAKMMMQEMATISHRDGWDNPTSLDNLYAINAKHPTTTGNQILKEAEARHQTAVQQKNLADFRKSQQELLKARVDAAAGNTFETKVSTIANLQTAYDSAVASGDIELADSLQTQLQAALTIAGRRGTADIKAAEPVVKEVGGVKVLYVPGSKQVHVIKNETSKNEFMTKNLPMLLRSGFNADEAVQKLDQGWGMMNPTAGAAPTALDPKDPLGVLKKR